MFGATAKAPAVTLATSLGCSLESSCRLLTDLVDEELSMVVVVVGGPAAGLLLPSSR